MTLPAELAQPTLAKRPLLHAKNVNYALRMQKPRSAGEWQRLNLSVTSRRQNKNRSLVIAPRSDKNHIPLPAIQQRKRPHPSRRLFSPRNPLVQKMNSGSSTAS
jgi:hypothetical protein